MSSFLDRFTGRTQLISKLGPQQLLRGGSKAIYTNSQKGFARSDTHQSFFARHQAPAERESAQEDRKNLHFPPLQPRYLKEELHKHSHSRLRLNKQTNWVIEEQTRQPEQLGKENTTIISVDLGMQHDGKNRKQQPRLKSHHHILKNVQHLGGLGPNIGGEDWQARREKQEKAKKYAQEVKRIRRERAKRDNQALPASWTIHP